MAAPAAAAPITAVAQAAARIVDPGVPLADLLARPAASLQSFCLQARADGRAVLVVFE